MVKVTEVAIFRKSALPTLNQDHHTLLAFLPLLLKPPIAFKIRALWSGDACAGKLSDAIESRWQLNDKLSGSSVVLLFVPEVVEEDIQPPLDDLGQGPGQGVVGDVQAFVHGVPGNAAQAAQQVQLIWQGLYGVVIGVQ